VRIGKDRAFRDCALASTGHAELEPVPDGLGDGEAVALGDLAIFVIADDLTQFALCFSLGTATATFNDPLATGHVADRH
jgi:hypothetical protein